MKLKYVLVYVALFCSGSANQIWASESTLTENLTLKQCYQLALKRSETIAMQKESIVETEAQFLKAMGEAVGDLDFVISNTRQEVQKTESTSSVGSTFTASSRRERKWSFDQPLFQGFKALGALSGAGSLRGEQKELYERAKELLYQEVVESFFGVLEAQNDREIVDSIKKLFEDRIAELKDRESIGRSRTSEVVSAISREKSIEAELADSIGLAQIAQYMLEYLTGVAIDVTKLVDEGVELSDSQDLSHYLMTAKTRADLRAQEQAVKTSWRNIIIAQSALWPQITMEGNSYEKREGFQSGIDWDLLLKITVPVYKGGTTVGEVKEAYSQWKQAKLSASKLDRDVELEIKKAYQSFKTSIERQKALKEALAKSEENYQLQKDEYSRNLVSNLEVLQALETLNDTRRSSNQADYQMKIDYHALQVAAGGIK